MNLALFDFDGTITNNDNFTSFVRYAVHRRRLILGRIVLFPILLCYKLRLISATRTREIVSIVAFRGRKIFDLMNVGRTYSQEVLPQFIRENALRRIRWHKEQGDRIVVVSASLGVYLRPWCEHYGLEVICTDFEVKEGIVTGRYRLGDCTGEEKAKRIAEKCDIREYSRVYAYGDTSEDREMLSLANIKYFRWKEVGEAPCSETKCDKGEIAAS